jgi:hypothetical protein
MLTPGNETDCMMKNGSKGVGLQDGTKKTKRKKRTAEQCGE